MDLVGSVSVIALGLASAFALATGFSRLRLLRRRPFGVILVTALVMIAAIAWWRVDGVRPFIATVPVVTPVMLRIARRPPSTDAGLRLIRELVVVAGMMGGLGLTLAAGFGDTLIKTTRVHFDQRRVSPDGRWEARLIQNGFLGESASLVLTPRGLATLDPFAYPDRRVGWIESDRARLRSIEWIGERTILVRTTVPAGDPSARIAHDGFDGVRWFATREPEPRADP